MTKLILILLCLLGVAMFGFGVFSLLNNPNFYRLGFLSYAFILGTVLFAALIVWLARGKP